MLAASNMGNLPSPRESSVIVYHLKTNQTPYYLLYYLVASMQCKYVINFLSYLV